MAAPAAAPQLAQLEPPAPPEAGPTPGRPRMAGPGWQAVDRRAIAGVLVVTVETERLDALVPIARDVLAPTLDAHVEAIVYFRRPGATDLLGRVEWTPAGGYVPLVWGPTR